MWPGSVFPAVLAYKEYQRVDMKGPAAGQRKRLVADVFDRAASSYDSAAGSYFSLFGPRLIDKLDIRPGATVVDVACGKGATLLPAARRCGSEGRAIGFDLSGEMVKHARATASDESAGNVHLAMMDGEAIALRDACADAVICGFSFHFFTDPQRAILEFDRILGPGGSVAISEWGPTDERWGWEDDLIGSLGVEGVSSGSFDTVEALEELLASTRFRAFDVTTEALDIWLKDEDDWWRWKWSYSFRHVLEKLDTDARDRFKDEAFDHLRGMRSDAGIPLTLYALIGVAREA